MGLTFDNNRPIYLQLMEYLYGQICRTDLKPGEKLPSVRELAVKVGVNPNTVSRTYMEMERKDIVVSKRGQGTFVTEDITVIQELRKKIADDKIGDFILMMNQIGLKNEEILQLMEQKMASRKEEEE
ncbi:GntR family transcriptional regulator [Salipaludibacillus aurantiacus]|uniref:DNA-binding transcriptional regulator YhcF, GntR family n=1 Tax=Salipaludibacillus aurantiacus TaxID=1601833 RepID=A0A1H9WEI0_9BACI|nr:GntR family transcriptional regulator [Salipaludibacillus aurantiacus]SES32097.1 DNA-binding transcriptional regulator YhcF, GntR family [Salipaludibacillus aurantiacus]